MVKSTIIRPTGLTMDVTPTPAILGLMENLQIEPWRCVAELVDNSLDDFQSNHSAQGVVDVDVLDKSLTVTDNGGGMSFDQLRDALRAGYSSKTKNSELGLFGIGFNLATAKLGRKATVITKKSNDKTWLQVEIDLNKLTKQNDFRLQPQQVSIDGGPDHGTIVSVDLSREHLKQFERNSYLNQIRNSLGRTYSYILRNSVQGLTGLASGNPRSVIVNVAGSAVEPFLPCIWDENRTVVYRKKDVKAVQYFNRDLPDAALCQACGRWQSNILLRQCETCESTNLTIEERKVWGWVGVQRYVDPLSFGLDFLRNGRAIEETSHELFNFTDPTTGDTYRDYPVEWPSDQGRIVGEVHMDHVLVDFTKGSFLKDDPNWSGAVEIIRGDSPLRPQRQRGSAPNHSPLATIFNAFRINEPGTRYLIPGNGKRAIHITTGNWAKKYAAGDADYQSDLKWYNACLNHDALKKAPKPPGPGGPGPGGPGPGGPGPGGPKPETIQEKMQRWKAGGVVRPDLTTSVTPLSIGKVYDLEAWETYEKITDDSGNDVSVYANPTRGNQVIIFASREHAIFTKYRRSTTDLILMEAANQIRTLSGSPVASSQIYSELLSNFPDEEQSEPILRKRVSELEERLKIKMTPVIYENSEEFWQSLSEENKNKTETNAAADDNVVWSEAIAKGDYVNFLTLEALKQLVEMHPNSFFDGKVFKPLFATRHAPEARKRGPGYINKALTEICEISAVESRLNEYELSQINQAISHLEDNLIRT